MNIAKDQLKAFIERVERLEAEKAELTSDIRDVYAEAKGSGFDVKALRAIVKLRKLDADQRREQEAILETYMHALGMLFDTPLGQAAVDRGGGSSGGKSKTTKPNAAGLPASAHASASVLDEADADATSSCGSVESKAVSGWSRRPLEHASRSIPSSDGLNGDTGRKDALAGIAQAVKSAEPTASDRRIPEQPEAAHATDGQVVGVAPDPQETNRPRRVPATHPRGEGDPAVTQDSGAADTDSHDGIPPFLKRDADNRVPSMLAT